MARGASFSNCPVSSSPLARLVLRDVPRAVTYVDFTEGRPPE